MLGPNQSSISTAITSYAEFQLKIFYNKFSPACSACSASNKVANLFFFEPVQSSQRVPGNTNFRMLHQQNQSKASFPRRPINTNNKPWKFFHLNPLIFTLRYCDLDSSLCCCIYLLSHTKLLLNSGNKLKQLFGCCNKSCGNGSKLTNPHTPPLS